MTLKIGDVVRLKSGGPKMTIESIGDFPAVITADRRRGPADKALCVWFEGNDPKQKVFHLETLQIASEED